MIDDNYKKFLLAFDTFGSLLSHAIDICLTQQKLTLEQLCDKVGVSKQTIYRLKNGGSDCSVDLALTFNEVFCNTLLTDYIFFKGRQGD